MVKAKRRPAPFIVRKSYSTDGWVLERHEPSYSYDSGEVEYWYSIVHIYDTWQEAMDAMSSLFVRYYVDELEDEEEVA